MIRKCLKCFGWLSISILILLLLLIAVFCFLIGTDRGLSFASGEATKRIEGLSFDDMEGNVFSGGIQMQSLQYSNASVEVNASGIDSSWKLRCAIQKKFCLETLRVEQLNVEVLPTTEKTVKTKEPISLPTIDLPIDATIDELFVSKLRVTLPDDSVHEINDVHLSAKATKHGIDIDDLSASYGDKTAKISGVLMPGGDYPLELNIAVTAEDILPEHLPEGSGKQPLTVKAILSNTVRDLAISAQTSGALKTTLTGSVQPFKPYRPIFIRFPARLQSHTLHSSRRRKDSCIHRTTQRAAKHRESLNTCGSYRHIERHSNR